MKIRLLGIYGLIFILFGSIAAIFFHGQFLAQAAYVEILVGLICVGIYAFYSFGDATQTLWRKRDAAFGVLGGLLLFLLLVGVNVVAHSKWGEQKFDLTVNKIHSLSNESLAALESLPQEIEVVSFVTDFRAKKLFANLIEKYAAASDKIKFRALDPDKSPQEVQELEAEIDQVILINSETGKRLALGESQFNEQELTTAIRRVLVDEVKTIYFLQGHGEGELTDDQSSKGLFIAKFLLEREGYRVEPLEITQGLPKDAAVIVSWGPQNAVSESETKILSAYLKSGGNLVIAQDPLLSTTKDRIIATGWESLLADYGLQLGASILVQSISFQSQNVRSATVLGLTYTDHPIVENLQGKMTQFQIAQSVNLLNREPVGTQKALVLSSESVSAVTDLKKLSSDSRLPDTGPYALGRIVGIPKGVEAEEEAPEWQSQIVVFGDSDFASNQHIQSSQNRDLFLNTFAYLMGEGENISIRPKSWKSSTLEITNDQKRGVYFASIFVIPQLIILFGLAIWALRRGRA